MFFMKDLLEIISNLSLSFQRDNIIVAGMLKALETANIRLVNLQVQPGECVQTILQTVQNQSYRLTNVELFDNQAALAPVIMVIETVREHINRKQEVVFQKKTYVFPHHHPIRI